ncbi:MAG: methyltransferase domain-containing protein [Pseudomonadota bacterium]
MAKKPGLEAAYALKSTEDVKELYAAWAGSYDSDFAVQNDYDLHHQVARGYAARGGVGPVLDVGAGTGLVGVALAALGVGTIHGTDISGEMLAQADAKGCYARVFVSDITRPLTDIADGTYAGIVSAGVFTLGHLGPEPIGELIRITQTGGLLALAVNATHWEAAGFEDAFAALGAQVTDLTRTPVSIYTEAATHDHAGDQSMLVTFRAA